MKKKNLQQNELKISLTQVASLIGAGKKITRGSIKKSQNNQKSQKSLDSKRSLEIINVSMNDSQMSISKIEKEKDNEKNKQKQRDKGNKKKINNEINFQEKNKNLMFKQYLGFPYLQSYIEDKYKYQINLQKQKKRSKYFENVKLSELSKNHIPHLIKIFFKQILTQNYEVKKGQLKKQKGNQKDQLLVDIYNPVNNKIEVRSINRQNGLVLSGVKIVLKKIQFQEFKNIFSEEIIKIKKNIKNNSSTNHINKPEIHLNQITQKYKKIIFQSTVKEQKMQIQNPINQIIPQSKEQIQFIEIKNSNELQNQELINQNQNLSNQQSIFFKFCLPGCNYILWPGIVYENIYGNKEQFQQIIRNKKYIITQKEQYKCFQMIITSSGLFPDFNDNQINLNQSQGLIQQQQTIGLIEQITSGLTFIVDRKQNQTENQKNISKNQHTKQIVYLIGANKFILSSNISYFQWQQFPDQSILDIYIKKTYFASIFEELQITIQRLNDFKRIQSQQCKIQQIRIAIDRLSKCLINNKMYLCIPLRYSNIQKKILVLLFNQNQKIQNNLLWISIEQIYPNFTVPQISIKHKILLYFSNNLKFNYLGLKQFILDIYSTYFYNQFPLQKYLKIYFDFQDSYQKQNKILKNNNLMQIQFNQNDYKNSKLQRCIQCYYPMHNLPFFKCYFCEKYCHKQCSSKNLNKSIELNSQQLLQFNEFQENHSKKLSNISNSVWICDTCEPCSLCLQPVGNKAINCMKCKNMFHEICGKLKFNENLILKQKYLCQNCIQCQTCQKKLKNLDYAFTKNGYQCMSCHKAQQANQICHICKKQGDGKWAQCSRQICGKWIHKYCDKYLQASKTFFTNYQATYFCPFCRKMQKRKIILKCIQILSFFDQYQYFTSNDYQDILDYKYIINDAMCLRKMNQKCLDGKYDQNTFNQMIKDFSLLISNALKYNMPKDQPHYQAKLLNIFGKFTFQKMKDLLQCTDEQIISGFLYQKLKQRKKQILRQAHQNYLQMIFNFQSEHSIVEVKRPKQKNQKLSINNKQLNSFQYQNDSLTFRSRYLLNSFFKGCMIKFKIKNKTPKIQNLFETQKVIQAYKAPIKDNYCYYHYWNSRVIFYCEICMQHYCCIDKCYRHEICMNCGIKGCACDKYQCGCGQLRERDKKVYEKMINDKFYDKRQLTENFKLCLKCSFEKLNTKICIYCQKSYQFYYDFQICKVCSKTYHKQCADVHASSQMSRFYFKNDKNSQMQELFSQSLRLQQTCYDCSTNRKHKQTMYEKLKIESVSRLIKLQKLAKYQHLFLGILSENGIKVSLTQLANLIFGNYEQFLKIEPIIEQYNLNYSVMKKSLKQNQIFQGKMQKLVKKLIQNTINLQKKQIKNHQTPLLLVNNSQKDQLSSSKSKDFNKNLIFSRTNIQQINQKHYSIISKFLKIFLMNVKESDETNYHSTQILKRLIQINIKEFDNIQLKLKIKRFYQLSLQNILNSIPTLISNQHSLSSNIIKSKQLISLSSQKSISNNNKKIQNNNNNNWSAVSLNNQINKNNKLNMKTFTELKIKSIQEIHEKLFFRKQNIIHTNRICMLCINTNYKNNIIEQNIKDFWLNYQNYIQEEFIDLHNQIILNYQKQNNQIVQQQHQKQENNSYNHNKISQQQCQQNVNKMQKQDQNKNINHQIIDIQIENQNDSSTVDQQQPLHSHFTTLNLYLEQKSLMLHYINTTQQSQISKYKRLSTMNKIITKFLLQTFESSKNVYRRGSTLILKNQIGYWRVLKKGKNKNQTYDISLKKQKDNKWYFSINQNVWWIETIEQMISKLKNLAKINNFRQLADFLGFTFKLIPLQKPNHFTRFLQTHPLDDLDRHTKKNMIIQLYGKYQWQKNGVFKKKKSQDNNEEIKQYSVVRKKPFYLRKRNQQQTLQQSIVQKKYSTPPYISFQDLKRDLLLDNNHNFPQQIKSQSFMQNSVNQIFQKIDNVFIAPSPIHKLGLFAKRFCPKNTIMVEYIGQIVSQALADVRQSKFHFGCYMFGLNRRNVDKKQIIDATYRGNMARYLNHCCDPNCKAKIQVINHQPRIFIYSIRDINQYQQLTYDYQFSVDANEKLICTCGAKNCQGRLN